MNVKALSKLILIGFASLCTVLPAAAQSLANAEASTVTVKGQVTCSRFIDPVFATKAMTLAQRIQACASQGNNYYTLVSGNRTYRLTGDKKIISKLAGRTVTVEGRFTPASSDVATYALVDTVQITNVVSTKN